MGIYKGQHYFYKSLIKSSITDFIKKERVVNVGIDIEHLIGEGRDLNYSDIELKEYILEYIKPLKDNGLNLFFVFGGKPSNDILTQNVYTNEYLKLKKNILKAFINQKVEIIICIIKQKLLNEVMLYVDITESIFDSLNVETIENIGNYVSNKTNNPIFTLYNDIFIKNELHLNNIPFDNLWELANEHWGTNMSKKRLEYYIDYIKENITDVTIIESIYDGDDQLIMMIELGIIDAIISKDSDMFAYNSKIIIINLYEDIVSYIKINNMYDFFKKEGYSKKVVKTAMIISSADYNYYMYDNYISFHKSLEISKKYKGNYDKTFEYFCNKNNKKYNVHIANEISHSFTTNFDNYIFNTLYSIKKSLYQDNCYIKLFNILLSSIINDNILNISFINISLQQLKNMYIEWK